MQNYVLVILYLNKKNYMVLLVLIAAANLVILDINIKEHNIDSTIHISEYHSLQGIFNLNYHVRGIYHSTLLREYTLRSE